MSTITKVSLTKAQLRNGAKAIGSTMYGQNGGLQRDRQNGDVELAVKNLTGHEMSQVNLAAAIKDVKVDGMPVDPLPNSWDQDGIDRRNDVVRQFVRTYFNQ